jgi:ATP-dependent RNA helicase DeaD
MEKFRELGLTEKTLTALEARGFEEPTEIQSITIPLLLKNESDIVAQAQTGTGKTATFALPLIERLRPHSKHPQAIVLAPTRELVIQIAEEINSLKGNTDITCAPIYGGQSMELQLAKLRKGVAIVVGTPGRILDHLERKTLVLDKIEYVILDEGDEMLNMGFIDDIESILEHTPEEKRVCLFSATMPIRIKELASKYMKDFKHVKAQHNLTTNLTDQIYFEVARQDKFEALCRIVDIEKTFYGIIFCRTKIEVDELASKLIDRGYSAEGLHGDISQAQRESILRKFRKQNISMLVATDVAARGIDINNLSHVINYSLPQDPESYIHRIGRTGRAGNQGTAVTFVTPDEFSKLGFIKRITKASIQRKEVPAVEAIVDARMDRINAEILAQIESDDKKGSFHVWADALIADVEPRDIVASVLKYSFGKVLDKSSYRKLTPVGRRPVREHAFTEEEGRTRLYIAKGRSSDFTKRSLVEFIVKKAGTSMKLIDDVEVFDNFSFITVPFAEAEHIIAKLKKSGENRRPLVEKAKPSAGGSDRKRGGRFDADDNAVFERAQRRRR